MHSPQSGIFALGTSSHSYLEFDLDAQGDPLAMVQTMANLRKPSMTTGGVNLVVGFRPSLWAYIAPDDMPPDVKDFAQDIHGVDGYTMPATQHDLWVWVAGHAYHTVFDVSREVMATLDHLAHLATEIAGWTYKESRDLTGFIDGTENPPLSEAPEVALVPDGFPGAGGSILLIQQWVHNVASWEGLTIEQQEKVIGRTKLESTELDEEVRGAQSHVSRNVIEVNGVEQHIFRRNSPYGTATDHGTMFIGFSCEQQRLARMLNRMAGAEDGIRDALTRYTTALSGAYYFVPSVQALHKFATEEDD
ncbi:MAG TPA: Dyp-type peroxidase [Ktedonobacteraceae bacterium]|nr:Dyp-type peroxidase [Ktedonobacteraceae bacterium]